MLLYLTQYLAQFESGFNVFNYLTMRAILGALTALLLSFVIGPRMIERLSVNQLGQPVREEGPETHLLKAGTPTMGGTLILAAISISTVLWADLENTYVWVVLFVTLSFGVIGYVDDYKKLILQDPAGISAKQKLFWQSSAHCSVRHGDQRGADLVADPLFQGPGNPPGYVPSRCDVLFYCRLQ
jgi:phospho-N-acetylmuramoyl-pentapeptide-transferase